MLLLALVLSGLAVAPLSAALQDSAGWDTTFPLGYFRLLSPVSFPALWLLSLPR